MARGTVRAKAKSRKAASDRGKPEPSMVPAAVILQGTPFGVIPLRAYVMALGWLSSDKSTYSVEFGNPKRIHRTHVVGDTVFENIIAELDSGLDAIEIEGSLCLEIEDHARVPYDPDGWFVGTKEIIERLRQLENEMTVAKTNMALVMAGCQEVAS